jgi:hypothetical protein
LVAAFGGESESGDARRTPKPFEHAQANGESLTRGQKLDTPLPRFQSLLFANDLQYQKGLVQIDELDLTTAMARRTLRMFRRFWIFALLVTFGACARHREVVHSRADVRLIKNSDVRWDGNFLGLQPNFSGASKLIVEDRRRVSFSELVSALDDERRYIAAHALLSALTGHSIDSSAGGIDPETGSILPGTEEAAGKFNGLRVDLRTDGSVVISDQQRRMIARKWKAWLKSIK